MRLENTEADRGVVGLWLVSEVMRLCQLLAAQQLLKILHRGRAEPPLPTEEWGDTESPRLSWSWEHRGSQPPQCIKNQSLRAGWWHWPGLVPQRAWEAPGPGSPTHSCHLPSSLEKPLMT